MKPVKSKCEKVILSMKMNALDRLSKGRSLFKNCYWTRGEVRHLRVIGRDVLDYIANGSEFSLHLQESGLEVDSDNR